jgi:hypothetical protein
MSYRKQDYQLTIRGNRTNPAEPHAVGTVLIALTEEDDGRNTWEIGGTVPAGKERFALLHVAREMIETAIQREGESK